MSQVRRVSSAGEDAAAAERISRQYEAMRPDNAAVRKRALEAEEQARADKRAAPWCCAASLEYSVPVLPEAPAFAPPPREHVLEQFRACTKHMLGALAQITDLRNRMYELDSATHTAARRIADQARGGSVTLAVATEIHAAETARALEGMAELCALARWPAWSSGAVREAREQVLSERMWDAWCVMMRSPAFRQPHLFMQIGVALFYEMCHGLDMEVCLTQDGAVARTQCAVATGAACTHRRARVFVFERDSVMHDIMQIRGVPERLKGFHESTLGHKNSILQMVFALFDRGIPLTELQTYCVRNKTRVAESPTLSEPE